MQTNNKSTEPEGPLQTTDESSLDGAACSPDFLATSETDRVIDDCENRGADYIAIILGEHARRLETQLNKARDAMAYLARRWEECEKRRDEEYDRNAQTMRQRDELVEALREMRYGHTDKAERMAVKALSFLENADVELPSERKANG